jgi:hypothetical protein
MAPFAAHRVEQAQRSREAARKGACVSIESDLDTHFSPATILG